MSKILTRYWIAHYLLPCLPSSVPTSLYNCNKSLQSAHCFRKVYANSSKSVPIWQARKLKTCGWMIDDRLRLLPPSSKLEAHFGRCVKAIEWVYLRTTLLIFWARIWTSSWYESNCHWKIEHDWLLFMSVGDGTGIFNCFRILDASVLYPQITPPNYSHKPTGSRIIK